MRSKRVIIFVASAALAGSIFGGSLAASATGSSKFPTTSKGLTYGSAMNVSMAAAPDLVQAVGDDGTAGYVLKSQLLDPASSPAEAVADEKAAEAGAAPEVIPLYDLNGNVIGTYTMSVGEVALAK